MKLQALLTTIAGETESILQSRRRIITDAASCEHLDHHAFNRILRAFQSDLALLDSTCKHMAAIDRSKSYDHD